MPFDAVHGTCVAQPQHTYVCLPAAHAAGRTSCGPSSWRSPCFILYYHTYTSRRHLRRPAKPKNNKPRTLARGHHQHHSMPHRGGVLPQAHSCIRCLDAPRDRTQVLGIQILRVACPATNEIATSWQPFAWSVHRDGILRAKHDVPVLVRQQPTGLLDATAYPAVPASQADFSNFMTFLASGSPAHSCNTLSRVGTHAIDAPGGSNGNIRAYFM
jgi:hypothetical protein